MFRFIVQRLGQTAIVLLGASVVVFVVLRVVPGDAVDVMYADDTGGTAEQRAEASRALGLDRPLPMQYFSFLGSLVRGDIGTSTRQRIPVEDLLAQALPHTIQLTVASLVIAVAIAVPIGMISALRQNSIWDRSGTVISLFGVSMPSFWQGIMLILVFAVLVPIFPSSGALISTVELETITGFSIVDSIVTGNFAALISALKHMALPAITLGTTSAAMIARLLRTGVLEVKNLDFVEALTARGVSQRVTNWHILRNALPATVIVFGTKLGTLLGGTLVVEVVFGWPGLGWLVIRALDDRDYPVLQGAVLLATLLVVLSNLLADIVHGWLDPRVKFASGVNA